MGVNAPTETFQLRRIHFVPAKRPDVTPVPTGVDIIVLNGVLPEAQDTMKPGPSSSSSTTQELFREQDVSLHWKTVHRAGAGLQNLGNTCFMNSVLQCLTHTPPLAEAMLAGKQLGSNKVADPLRLTQQQVINSLQNRHKNSSVAPMAHAKTLKLISRSFRHGRQEDAHEYLVALLDAMHESYLNMCRPKPSPELSQTSMIYRIFAGRIRSQVKCTECGHESNTYDMFLDLSLEINKASSVLKALQRFTSSEYLDGANKYICPKQKKKVRAAKCITIDQAPAVLVIQLKRFEFSMFGHKINKQVEFETELDLGPFMSARRGPPQPYTLYGVLVHSGHSVHSGHYFAFVKAPNGLWHQLDDQNVSQVSERMVLGQKAYILFYIKTPTNGHTLPAQPKPGRTTASASADKAPAALRKGQQASQAEAPHLQPAPTKAQATAHASSAADNLAVPANGNTVKASKSAAPVFGPAERPRTGLAAAAELREQLLAPPAPFSTHQQKYSAAAAVTTAGADAAEAQAAAQAASLQQAQGVDTHTQQRPAAQQQQEQASTSSQQAEVQPNSLPSQRAKAVTVGGSSPEVKPAGKRKSAALGVSNARPSVLKRMNAEALGGAANEGVVTSKKRKKSAMKAAAEGHVESVVRADAPGNATQSSQPAEATAEQSRQGLPSSSRPADKELYRPAVQRLPSKAEGPASPALARGSPARQPSAIHSPARRQAASVLYSSPRNDWQGRFQNRHNLHNQLHRSHQLSSPGRPPFLPCRSSSASPEKPVSQSPAKASAAMHTASSNGISPAEQSQPIRPDAAGVSKSAVKRKLLHTAAADTSTAQSDLQQHQQQPQLPQLASGKGVSKAQHQNGSFASRQISASHSLAEQPLSNGDRLAEDVNAGNVAVTQPTHAAPSRSDQTTSQQQEQRQQQDLALQSNGFGQSSSQQQQKQHLVLQNGSAVRQQAEPANAKEFLRSVQEGQLAPWDDVDPDLAKHAAALNRRQAPRRKKGLDDWDAEYDKGKVKKVKSKRGGPDAWQQGTDVFGKAARRGRGRGSFRGKSRGRGGRGGSSGHSPRGRGQHSKGHRHH